MKYVRNFIYSWKLYAPPMSVFLMLVLLCIVAWTAEGNVLSLVFLLLSVLCLLYMVYWYNIIRQKGVIYDIEEQMYVAFGNEHVYHFLQQGFDNFDILGRFRINERDVLENVSQI